MKVKGMELAWISVSDFEKAIKFYTEILGLKLLDKNDEWGWAELGGHEGGARIGIARYSSSIDEIHSPIKPGQNALMTFTVDNLDQTIQEMKKNDVQFIGDVVVVPEEVKMQTVKDKDGNILQFVEMIRK